MESASKAAEAASDTEKNVPLQAPAAVTPAGVARAHRFRATLWALAVAVVGVVTCFAPIGLAGLWDPVEVDTADLARRAAVHVLHASTLQPEGLAEPVPTVEEVGRGELPVLSMALGLRLFGAHAWALRLPLAVWTLIGAAALYWLVSRLEGRKTAWLSVLVLLTSPVVFVQARTALGEAVTLAAITLAFSGLLLAWADPHYTSRGRSVALGLGVLGLIAGWAARGVLLGVGLPALAAGLTWLVMGGLSSLVAKPDAPAQPPLGGILGAASLALGVAATVWGSWALFHGHVDTYSKVIGSSITDPKQLPTHDVVIHYLGHGMFPWSALAPLAFGALLRRVSSPRIALRVGLAVVLGLGVLFYTLVISRTGTIAFGPSFAVAACCAIALLSLDAQSRGVLPIMVCAALLVLLYKDFENFPEKGLSAFALGSAGTFPDAMKLVGKRYLQGATAFGLLTCVAIIIGRVQWQEIANDLTSSNKRIAKVTARALLTAISLLNRIATSLLSNVHRPRGLALASSLCVGGLILSLGYYPALAAQLSPAGVYTAYASHAGADEPLAVMGEGAVKGSLFYAGGSVKSFKALEGAVDWLGQPDEPRKWLILKTADLARANSRFRDKTGQNLPVLNAESSEILLASNALKGEKSTSPLDAIVLNEPPRLRHTPKATWGAELELVGWELRPLGSTEATDTITPGKTYSFVTVYRVLKRVMGSWESFIHVDGNGKRINGDHPLTAGKYPLRSWLPDDIIVDTFELKVDPTYDNGEYTVYFGLFSGNKRHKLTAGEGTEDRLTAGVVRVAR